MDPQLRITHIYNLLAVIQRKQAISICIARTWGDNSTVWWHPFDSEDWNPSGRYRQTSDIISADILIMIAVGNDHAGMRRSLEQQGFKGLLCFWLFDNHLAHDKNRATVLEGDFYFCSHHGQMHEDYLLNEQSVAGPLIPACYVGRPLSTITTMLQRFNDLPRLSKVVAPYFLYNYPALFRTGFLERLQAMYPEILCLYTKAENRQDEYHGVLTEDEKCARWLYFKSSIVVPMYYDLSTRIFDGLMWGQTLLVPTNLPAFDHVFSETDQEELGIVRYEMESGSDADIKAAAREALRIFDETGRDGITYRHNFVVKSHMRAHRIRAILSFLEDFSAGRTKNVLFSGSGISGIKSLYQD